MGASRPAMVGGCVYDCSQVVIVVVVVALKPIRARDSTCYHVDEAAVLNLDWRLQAPCGKTFEVELFSCQATWVCLWCHHFIVPFRNFAICEAIVRHEVDR